MAWYLAQQRQGAKSMIARAPADARHREFRAAYLDFAPKAE
jgi:hypothetical protein